MNSNRKAAILVGALILFAYAVLASSVIESKVVVMFSEALSGVAVIAIAIIMLPLFKPFGKKASFTYIFGRCIEGALMVVTGVLFFISSNSSLKLYDGINVVQAYIFSLSALVFYYLLYQSKLIPRWLSVWGFIASILLIIVILLEAVKIAQPSMILYSPIILNEVVLALWLIIKGFNVFDTKKS